MRHFRIHGNTGIVHALGAVLAALAALVVTGFGPGAARADDFLAEAKKLRSAYAGGLDELAGWCEGQGLVDEARATRRLVVPQDPYKIFVPVLPDTVGSLAPPEGVSPEVAAWSRRLGTLRRQHAEELYGLARQAVRTRRASLALELVLAAVHADPDHEAARRILGFQKYRDQWVSPFAANKLRRGQVDHKRFGWLPKDHVERYEQGLRLHAGRWISAEDDARFHQDMRNGWLVETQHYSIRTNHSLEAGVQLGEKLERLMRVWRQLFFRYYTSESQLTALFTGGAIRRPARSQAFRVAFFRDRDDYNRTLKPLEPNIQISIGFYHERSRRAYFFAGKDYEDRTLFHEATHQLFHQSRPVAPSVGRRANFWIVEGVAMYMESLREEDGYYVLGGLEDDRAYAARYRLLHDRFYVPFEEFAAMGMEQIQRDPRIATLYSQAAGQTHFLIHAEGGRYRDALVAYLDAVYAARDLPNTLSDLSGTSFAELDRRYRQFMASGGGSL